MQLDTVGLINACIDINTQMPFYPQFAFNNTYGIKAIDETQYKTAVSSFPKCKNLTDTCRSMAEKLDPLGLGNSSDVNKACYGAYTYCFDNMWLPYQGSGVSVLSPLRPLGKLKHNTEIPIRHHESPAKFISIEIGSWLFE